MKQSDQKSGSGRRLLALTCLLGAIAGAPAFAAYTLVDLGVNVAPKDINNHGIVVGARNVGQYPTNAFLYDSDGLLDLDGTVAYAINDAGLIAGNTLTGAFVLDGNNLRTWDEQGAYGISETGLVSGNKAGRNPYRTTSIPYNPAVYEGGKWDVMDIAQVYPRGTRDGVYADIFLLDDVNDAGYAVGSKRRYGLVGSSAIMIAPPYNAINSLADVTYLPTPSGGVASAINNANIIVGTTGNNSRTGDYATAFVSDGGETAILLGTLGGLRSSGLDINDCNTVVGSSETGADVLSHAVVWNADCKSLTANSIEDLNDWVNAPNWVLTSATAINERGDIVGTAQVTTASGAENHGFLLLADGAVPPPPITPNQPPQAIADADRTSGKAPLTVNFAGDRSTDPDGDTLSYHWDFGDGKSSTEVNPSHTYRKSGTYVAVLTVTDGDLTGTAEMDISVDRRK